MFWRGTLPCCKSRFCRGMPMETETTITKVGKDVYVTREAAEADVAVVCK